MRSRMALFAILIAVSSLILPLVAQAQAFPFFGPIIPPNYQTCPAGWGAVMIVVNNIIRLLISLAIVFIAPLMIAWSGFLFVVNPVNSGGIEQAKSILTHTVVGIIIALAGWLIVNALMAVLYNPSAQSGTTKLQAWYNLVTGSGDFCINQAGIGGAYTGGSPPVTYPTVVVPPVCPAPLSQVTDPLALQLETAPLVWSNTDPRLQPCVNKFIGLVGGSPKSAYRPQAYQTHLWEIRDRWCTKGLRSNANPDCSALKESVRQEVNRHFGSSWSCGAVAATNSTHSSGIGVDISGINHGSAAVQQAASDSCLIWRNYSNDPYHYDLKSSCSCN